MSQIPNDLLYSRSHEWVRVEENGEAYVGITDHAQGLLGDLVYVELPDIDAEISEGDEIGVVESVKTASDLISPLSGDIIEINEDLADSPEIVNNDCYGDGWLVKIKMSNKDELENLLKAEDYQEFCDSEEH
ncbi:MAG: glycine cleavage system protein GcvH [Pseudomonadota bacterium]